jgi:hypothetical protein
MVSTGRIPGARSYRCLVAALPAGASGAVTPFPPYFTM